VYRFRKLAPASYTLGDPRDLAITMGAVVSRRQEKSVPSRIDGVRRHHAASWPRINRSSLGAALIWSASARAVTAFAIILVVDCASAKPSAPAHPMVCDAPLEINSTASFLSSTAHDADGILIFRGVSYRFTVSKWPSNLGAYHATGTACGLDIPMDITGPYRIEAKDGVWRKQNKVEIHVQPPFRRRQSQANWNLNFRGHFCRASLNSLA
jgi:hypothetical protein